jgi:hypothetical protein
VVPLRLGGVERVEHLELFGHGGVKMSFCALRNGAV